MKGIVANFLFVIVWAVVAHFFPLAWLLSSLIFFPAVFIVSGRTYAYAPLSHYTVVPYSLALILVSDFLMRKYGGGNCDQLGSFLIGTSFLITLVVSSIALIPASINLYMHNRGMCRVGGKERFKIVLYVLAMLQLVFALASVIEPEINLWWRQYLSLAL